MHSGFWARASVRATSLLLFSKLLYAQPTKGFDTAPTQTPESASKAALPPPSPPPAANDTGAAPTAPLMTVDSREVTVVARDGAVFRGTLVENVPGQYVTLRLETGEYRRIQWYFIARISEAGDASLTGPQVTVEFRADDPRAALQKRREDGSWFDACLTPCSGLVSATGLYRVGGQGIRASEPFRLYSEGGPVRVEAEVGTTSRVVIGAILGIGGGVVAYVGGLIFLIASTAGASTTEGGETTPLSAEARDDLRTTGGLMFLGGAGAGIAGLVILLNSGTDVHFPRPGAARRALKRSSSRRDVLSIPMGKHLELTERGLVF